MFRWLIGIWLYPLIISSILTLIMYKFRNEKYLTLKDYKVDFIMGTIMFFVIMLLVSFIGVFISFDNLKETNKTQYVNRSESIYSLRDNSNIKSKFSGSFLYSSGYIESDLYYYVMIGNNEEGYLVEKFNSSETYVHFDEDCKNPRYEEIYEEYNLSFTNNIIFGKIFKPFNDSRRTRFLKQDLYLPKDSIQINYEIDLK